jgi:RHS repeat-associated protein
MEKDDEIKSSEGTSYDFGARMYDPRIGRWLSVDAISKPFITPYNFGSNNPMIFIDPDGNTDYYFNGRFKGSDGKENGLIGVVHSRSLVKDIKKGDFSKIKNIENGAKFKGGFIIHKDILESATEIADKAFSEKGENREFATSLDKTEDGKGYQAESIVEGDPIKLGVDTEAHVTIPDGKVSIHSHPTGVESSFDTTPSKESEVGAGSDENRFKAFKMNIIVGNSPLGVASRYVVKAAASCRSRKHK